MRLTNRWFLFFAFCFMHNVAEAAYFALTSDIPKCFTIYSYKGSKIAIEYESPDVQPLNNGGQPIDMLGRSQGGGTGDPAAMMKERNARGEGRRTDGDIGLDKMYDERQRVAMKQAMLTMNKEEEAYLTISEFEDMHDDDDDGTGTGKPKFATKKLLRTSRGMIHYVMSEYNTAQICIRSPTATFKTPLFISLHIREVYELPKPEKVEQDEKAKRMVDNHMRYLEREIHLLLQLTNRLLDGSTASKISHSSFKDVLVGMHQKFKWYSILQILITLVAGAFYMKTLLAFLRKRKIIY